MHHLLNQALDYNTDKYIVHHNWQCVKPLVSEFTCIHMYTRTIGSCSSPLTGSSYHSPSHSWWHFLWRLDGQGHHQGTYSFSSLPYPSISLSCYLDKDKERRFNFDNCMHYYCLLFIFYLFCLFYYLVQLKLFFKKKYKWVLGSLKSIKVCRRCSLVGDCE